MQIWSKMQVQACAWGWSTEHKESKVDEDGQAEGQEKGCQGIGGEGQKEGSEGRKGDG